MKINPSHKDWIEVTQLISFAHYRKIYESEKIPTIQEWIGSDSISIEIKQALQNIQSDPYLPGEIRKARLDVREFVNVLALHFVGVATRNEERKSNVMPGIIRSLEKTGTRNYIRNSIKRTIELPQLLQEVSTWREQTDPQLFFHTKNDPYQDEHHRIYFSCIQAIEKIKSELRRISQELKNPSKIKLKRSIPSHEIAAGLACRLYSYTADKTGRGHYGLIASAIGKCGFKNISKDAVKLTIHRTHKTFGHLFKRGILKKVSPRN